MLRNQNQNTVPKCKPGGHSGCSLQPEARGVQLPRANQNVQMRSALANETCILASIAPSFCPGATPCFTASQSSAKAAANVQLQPLLIRVLCSRLCQCHRRCKVLVQAAALAVEAVVPKPTYREPVCARTAGVWWNRVKEQIGAIITAINQNP